MIKLWRTVNGSLLYTFKASNGPINSLIISDDNHYLSCC